MSIAKNLKSIQDRIHKAEIKYSKKSGSVKLLTVSKNQSIAKIKEAIQAGQRFFGENFLQEALEKIQALSEYELEWHFIGTIQSNKTKAIAENFSWVHSVSRLKTATRLNEQRPPELLPLNVCIEVNINEEASKSGVGVDAVMELASEIDKMENLRLRGLMAIPKISQENTEQLSAFRQVAALQQRLVDAGLRLDMLSMGMTNDFEMAIEAGGTIVRIGTAIFGKRGKG